MNAPVLEFTPEERAFSHAEIAAFKDYLMSRADLLPKGDQLNKHVGLLIGAMGHVIGDFIGYSMEKPENTLESLNQMMLRAAMNAMLERIITEHPMDSAP